MKHSKLKAKVRPKDAAAAADRLGQSYVDIRERLKSYNDQRNLVVEQIKATATDVGTVEGPQTTIVGNKFRVGFVTTSPRKTVDWEKFKRIRPKLYARLCSLQIDDKKVEDALADGTLPRELLEKYVITVGDPVDRVLVEEVGKESNEETEDLG